MSLGGNVVGDWGHENLTMIQLTADNIYKYQHHSQPGLQANINCSELMGEDDDVVVVVVVVDECVGGLLGHITVSSNELKSDINILAQFYLSFIPEHLCLAEVVSARYY